MVRRGTKPLWLGEPGRFAGLERGPARALLAALAVLMLLSLGAVSLGAASEASTASEGPGDLALYQGIVEALRHGGRYYEIAAEALRAGGYPMKPFFTFRLPTLAVVEGALPDRLLAFLLGALCVATIVTWHPRIAELLPRLGARLLATALLLAGLVAYAQPGLALFHEIWAGLLIALSLGRWRPGRWQVPVALGLAACMIRETAALYLVVMAALAWIGGARREALAWSAALGVLAIVLAAHATAVADVVRPLDPHGGGWAGLLGPGAFARAVAAGTALTLLPLGLAAPVIALALFGWTVPRSAWALRVAGTSWAYAALLSVAGGADHFYWALLVAAPLLIGVAFAPDGLRDLWAAATGRRRIIVRRVVR